MYQVFWDEFLLHDLRLEDYYLKNEELSEEINKVAEFIFNIYPEHPHFSKLEVLAPNIMIKKDSKIIFIGRIISEKMNMDKSKQVTCESILAFLFDSIQRPFDFKGTPEELFIQLINNHNNQVEEYKKFKIGILTGANLDNNDYINKSNTDYINTFDTIKDKILNTIGGYIQIRYETDGNYIDWLDDFTSEINGVQGQIVSNQVIEFGENLIDITAENDATETYSVVIPLGAEIEIKDEETGEITKKRLTIEEVNEGNDYLVNEEALAKYGWIVAPTDKTTWNDVTIASNLKTKAQDFLNNQGIMLKSTLELNALDLNVVDKNIDDFKMGEYIKVQSTPHNLSKTYLLTKKITPLSEPENMKVTLGESKNTLTGIQIGNEKDTISKIETILGDYVLNKDVTNIVNEEIKNSSIITQLPDKILSEVSEQYTKKSQFEEYQEEISTQLEQTSSDFTISINEIHSKTTELENEVNTNLENTYQEITEKFDDYVPQNDFDGYKEQIQGELNNTYNKEEIDQKLSDGSVSMVKTTTGTFDADGLTIDSNTSLVKNLLAPNGMIITDKTGSSDTELLFAGYDEDLHETIVRSKNMVVEKYFTVAENSRIEKYETGAGIFWVGD